MASIDIAPELMGPLEPADVFPKQETMPPIRFGVGSLGQDSWSMGSLMLCDKVGWNFSVEDVLTTWLDDDGTWCLRRRASPLEETTPPPGDSDVGRIYLGETRSAVWLISPNVWCKTSSWVQGMTPEADTIKWVVENCPEVPVPQVIHSWTDLTWHQTFCLMYVVPGISLDKAWFYIPPDKRWDLLNEVIEYVDRMAQHTSSTLSTIAGDGITYHGDIAGYAPYEMNTWLGWQPDCHSVMTAAQFRDRMLRISGNEGPEEVDHFVFNHGNLIPESIFVKKGENGEWHLSGLIDWEVAGYLPKWYIASRALARLTCVLYVLPLADKRYAVSEWTWNFLHQLGNRGFIAYACWMKRAREYMSQRKVSLALDK
ncbi:MAG: hypothetical protein Q9190_006263 [Brigantiaea leucoxantha]